jgi:hypothetical protein
MAQSVCILLGDEDRVRLAAIAGDRNRPQKHVQRAGIVLLWGDRLPAGGGAPDRRQPTGGMAMAAALRRAGCRRAVARQNAQARQETDAGGDRGQNPGAAVGKPSRQATHWTGRMVAKAAGVSLRAVQRVWQANRLQPHRVRAFKASNDPAFAEKVEDV